MKLSSCKIEKQVQPSRVTWTLQVDPNGWTSVLLPTDLSRYLIGGGQTVLVFHLHLFGPGNWNKYRSTQVPYRIEAT